MVSDSARKLRVLVADDHAGYREMLSEILAEDGHQVEQAVNGADAWVKLQEQLYDYVVMDLRMPEMNGLEVLRLMRRLKPKPRTILVTGEKTLFVEQMALNLGAAGCYQKPMSPDLLLADLMWAPRISADSSAMSSRVA